MIGGSDKVFGLSSWPHGRRADSTRMHKGMLISMAIPSTKDEYLCVKLFVVFEEFVGRDGFDFVSLTRGFQLGSSYNLN